MEDGSPPEAPSTENDETPSQGNLGDPAVVAGTPSDTSDDSSGHEGGGSSADQGNDGGKAKRKRRRGRGDAWLVWSVSFGAIAIPVIILATMNYLDTDRFRLDDVATSFDRGDFLVPALILAADSVRKMWREVKCDGLWTAGYRLFITSLCALFGIACFAGIVMSAQSTTATERTALGQLTIATLVVALVASIVALGLPPKEAGQG